MGGMLSTWEKESASWVKCDNRNDIEVCWVGSSRSDDLTTLLNERLVM
jgi:hypothetical protein